MAGTSSLRLDPSLNGFLLTTRRWQHEWQQSLPPWSANSQRTFSPYFGVQPNQAANLGRYVNLSRVQILSGSTPLVDQVFTSQSSLNTSVLVVRAGQCGGGPDAAAEHRLSSFVARASFRHFRPAVSLFCDRTMVPVRAFRRSLAGSRNITFLPASALPSAGAGFFPPAKTVGEKPAPGETSLRDRHEGGRKYYMGYLLERIRGARSRNNRVRPRHICSALKLDVRIVQWRNRCEPLIVTVTAGDWRSTSLASSIIIASPGPLTKSVIKIISVDFELDAIDGGLVLVKCGLTRAARKSEALRM